MMPSIGTEASVARESAMACVARYSNGSSSGITGRVIRPLSDRRNTAASILPAKPEIKKASGDADVIEGGQIEQSKLSDDLELGHRDLTTNRRAHLGNSRFLIVCAVENRDT